MSRFLKVPAVAVVAVVGTKKEVEVKTAAIPVVKDVIEILLEKEGIKNLLGAMQVFQEKEGVSVKVISFS